eukprot:7161885-Pyramimonas_sp.AAC.1
MDVKGNSVEVKGNNLDVKGNSVDVKGNSVDVKGNILRTRQNSADCVIKPLTSRSTAGEFNSSPIICGRFRRRAEKCNADKLNGTLARRRRNNDARLRGSSH